MKYSLNNLYLGLISGLLIPVIALLIFYLSTYNNQSFIEYLNHLISINIVTQLVSLCVVPNLLLFFIFIWTNKLYSARGVLFSTIIYTIIVIDRVYPDFISGITELVPIFREFTSSNLLILLILSKKNPNNQCLIKL